jgi:hypothetical protein
MPSGDYNINFVPEEGSSFIPISRWVRASDNSRFKVFEHNGHRVGEYSHKGFRSKVETARKQLGADPYSKAELLYCSIDQALAEIQRALESTRATRTPEMGADLEKLSDITCKRKEGRAKLLLESCGGSEQVHKHLLLKLGELSKVILEINDLREKTKKAAETELPGDFLADAAYKWPMSELFASQLALYLRESGPRQISDWVARYAHEFRKAMGVDMLEYSSYDIMRELEHALLRVGDEAKKPEAFAGKACAFISSFARQRNRLLQ